MKRTITTLAATLFASLAIAVGAGAAAADGCSMPVPTGTAPCPPPIVSTSGGDSIGGDANTDPVNMGDLTGENTYEYVAPSWTPDDDDDEGETPDDETEAPADSE